MFNTLYGKLVTVFVGLLGLIGTVYILLTAYTTRMYLQELSQEFNRTLAENLVSGKSLMQDGQVDQAALTHVFEAYMDINPKLRSTCSIGKEPSGLSPHRLGR